MGASATGVMRRCQVSRVDPVDTESGWREIEGAREFIAKKIAPRFGVNHQVIETRFDHEGIWPVE